MGTRAGGINWIGGSDWDGVSNCPEMIVRVLVEESARALLCTNTP